MYQIKALNVIIQLYCVMYLCNDINKNKIYPYKKLKYNILLVRKTLKIGQKSMFLYVHSYVEPTLNSCCNIIIYFYSICCIFIRSLAQN